MRTFQGSRELPARQNPSGPAARLPGPHPNSVRLPFVNPRHHSQLIGLRRGAQQSRSCLAAEAGAGGGSGGGGGGSLAGNTAGPPFLPDMDLSEQDRAMVRLYMAGCFHYWDQLPGEA